MLNIHESFACTGCDGTGETECYHCGSETDCEECNGTGLDESKIDVERFKKAHDEMMKAGGTWAITEDKVEIGRQSKEQKLYYRDFVK